MNRTKKNSRQFNIIVLPALIAAVLALLFIFALTPNASAETEEVKTLRVGYFALEGYQEMDGDGVRSGYGYDFLTKLRRYEDITYEYVGYDCTADEAKKMLLSGQIDFLTPATMSDSDAESFDFSMPIGSLCATLNVKADDDRFDVNDYSTYDGMNIGMTSNDEDRARLEEFLAANGITARILAYRNNENLHEALRNGFVDAIYVKDYQSEPDEKMLNEVATEYIYAIVKRGNTDVLSIINNAILQMDQAEGDWRIHAHHAATVSSDGQTVVFTEEEKEYIQSHQAGGEKIRLAVDNRWSPFIYKNGDDYAGVIRDYWDLIMNMTGMDYEFCSSDDDIFDEQRLIDGEADIYLGYCFDADTSEKQGFLESTSFLQVDACYITLNGTNNIQTIGVSAVNPRLNSQLEAGSQRIIEYRDADTVIQALKDGEIDAAFLYDLEGQQVINEGKLGALIKTQVPEISLEFCAIAPMMKSHTLIGIVSKCIAQIDDATVTGIISDNTTLNAGGLTLSDYAAIHPIRSVALALLMLVPLALYIVSVVRKNNQRKKQLDEISTLNASLESKQTELTDALNEMQRLYSTEEALHEESGSSAWWIKYDENGEISDVYWSNEMRHMLGFEDEHDLPNTAEAFMACVHPDDIDALLRYTDKCNKDTSGQSDSYVWQYRIGNKEKEYHDFRMYTKIIRHSNGTPALCRGILQNITDLREEQQARLESANAISAINKALGTGIWKFIFDEKGNVSDFKHDEYFSSLIGFNDEFPAPKNVWDALNLIHPEDKEKLLKLLHGLVADKDKTEYTLEHRMITANGEYKWFRSTGSLSRRPDGTPAVFYGVLTKANEIDETTGLPNRNGFSNRVGTMLEKFPDEDYTFVIIDILDFRYINNEFGRENGDKVLRYVSDWIKQFANEEKSVLGYFGGSQFIVMMDSAHVPAADILKNELNRVADESPVGQIKLKLGVYRSINRALDTDQIIDNALTALNSTGNGYNSSIGFYNALLEEKIRRERIMELSFAGALENEEFKVFYQPKYSPYTGGIMGAEALVRWIEADGKIVSPGEFIPLFERNGQIRALDKYMFERVCAFLAQRREKELPVVPVSVNLSRLTLLAPGIVEEYGRICEKYKISKELVPIEITESASLSGDQISTLIKVMKSAGFSLHMDDFGSGYSSLFSLGTLPFDTIKLDKSLTDTIGSDDGELIIQHIMEVIHDMGKTVVAEGVEQKDQVLFLRKFHCEAIQGFYYSRPLTREDFEERLNGTAAEKLQNDSGEKFVLVIDDMELNREYLDEVLSSDYNVVTASSGDEGLQVMEEKYNSVSLVLLDVVMPEKDGFDILREMKERRYTDKVPVIMISSDESEEFVKTAYRLGAADYVTRPKDLPFINQRIANVISAMELIKRRREV